MHPWHVPASRMTRQAPYKYLSIAIWAQDLIRHCPPHFLLKSRYWLQELVWHNDCYRRSMKTSVLADALDLTMAEIYGTWSNISCVMLAPQLFADR